MVIMAINETGSHEHFMSIEWCAKLINQADYHVAVIKPPPKTPQLEGQLLGNTLRTADTIKAALCLYKVEKECITEVINLLSIGTGLNGLPDAAHGGMIATFLDEACGIFASTQFEANSTALIDASRQDRFASIWPSNNTATIYLNVTYLKFVKTPAVIAVRACLKERSGRKMFVNGQIEDGSGMVLARAETLFIVRRDAKI